MHRFLLFKSKTSDSRGGPFSTIEWVASYRRFKVRAIIQHVKSRDLVAFNSWHQDFGDAERAIDLLSDSLSGVGERQLYNVFGVTLDEHPADIGGGPPVSVSEVLVLIWSQRQIAAA